MPPVAGSRLDSGQDAGVTPDGHILVADLGDLYILDADGSNPRKLISGMDGFVGNAAMAPDGKQIAFSFYRAGMGGVAIYLANSDGSFVRKVADSNYGFCCPAWANDGRYCCLRHGSKLCRNSGTCPCSGVGGSLALSPES